MPSYLTNTVAHTPGCDVIRGLQVSPPQPAASHSQLQVIRCMVPLELASLLEASRMCQLECQMKLKDLVWCGRMENVWEQLPDPGYFGQQATTESVSCVQASKYRTECQVSCELIVEKRRCNMRVQMWRWEQLLVWSSVIKTAIHKLTKLPLRK